MSTNDASDPDDHDRDDPPERLAPEAAPEGRATAKPPGPGSRTKGPRNQPPKEFQFKPGRSGNPRGRPKRAKNLKTVVRDVMGQKIALRTQGRRTTVSAAEAALNKALATALASGKVRDVIALFQLAERHGLAADDAGPAGLAPLKPEDEADLTDFLRRLKQGLVLAVEDTAQPAAAGPTEPASNATDPAPASAGKTTADDDAVSTPEEETDR